MKHKAQIAAAIFFPIYLATVLLTDLSFTGYWTDVVFSIVFSVYALGFSFNNELGQLWQTWILRIANSIAILVVFGLLGINLINPFAWDVLKLRSFYFQQVNGRLFNAYFKPVGAYSGGYGNFWITESPKYLPIFEWQVYWDRTVRHDFRDDNFEGQPIDNYEVVKFYIKDKVIDGNQ